MALCGQCHISGKSIRWVSDRAQTQRKVLVQEIWEYNIQENYHEHENETVGKNALLTGKVYF